MMATLRKLSYLNLEPQRLVGLCEELGYTPSNSRQPQQFVELRDLNGRLVPFAETPTPDTSMN